MVNFIIRYLLIAVAISFLANLIKGISIDSFGTAILVALGMGFVNTFVKPILKIVSFPITIVSFGIFLLVINVILVYVVEHFVDGFSVNGFLAPLLFSFGVSIASTIVGWFFD